MINIIGMTINVVKSFKKYFCNMIMIKYEPKIDITDRKIESSSLLSQLGFKEELQEN